jgi:hypothetical protein
MSEEVRGRGSYVAREMGGIADPIRVERGRRVVRSLVPVNEWGSVSYVREMLCLSLSICTPRCLCNFVALRRGKP